jgi:hypothetical protein
MRKLYPFIILLTAVTYSFGQTTSQATENFKKLNWLVGTWNRTDTKPGRSGLEQWVKIDSQELLGIGVNMRDTDTVFVEKLRIIVKDDNIFYVADVPENQKLVYFKLTEITESGFVCENPDHDFPKKISYQLDGKKLKAQISGDGKVIGYLFEKSNDL